MKKLYWRIRGYDGLSPIFDKTVGIGQFSDNQMSALLKSLTAKACLSYEEIVRSYAKRRTKLSNDLLVCSSKHRAAIGVR